MNSFDPHRESSSLRYNQQDITTSTNINHNINLMGGSATPSPSSSSANPINNASHFTHDKFRGFPELDDHDLAATVVPAVTVVLEGRSICHRINLHHHDSYHSLAKALRQMFVVDHGLTTADDGGDLDLSNAIPGHLIAYEDMENDLLLAGDLNWKDFVRVAKRIRIIPAKENSRKGKRTGA
ncbi:auxin-responsive protein IAA33-like [Neltuma alba]|uniref:auxin-responsive protein IAA33-like n=1 Tax=Neltuma alba TaxID=207710 RepID=UPI0010A2E583|nr:auxin-responsive protein IAA33-like [Prosopis alba]